jgi:hypothetical protein
MGPMEQELVFRLYVMTETELASKIFSETTPEFLSKTMPPLLLVIEEKVVSKMFFLKEI